MKSARIFLLLVVIAAQAQAVELVDPADVVPGSAGVCVTEMDGGEMVEIPLTVIGTIGPWTPEGEIVLVRLEDDRFRHTGIIAGMSGSPVYVDGRLLGALAFGWSFSKEPIGGVTPFSRMMSLSDDRGAAGGAGPGRPALVEMMEASRELRLGEVLTDWLLPDGAGELRSLPVAVTASGVWSPSGGHWLAESWRRLGWVSVPGGSVETTGEAEIEPGAMVAGVLVDGDAVLAAGGTVTEVRGDEVWAFGHPFLGAGGFQLPMARAHVLTVLPSQANSFKFFSAGETIGSFFNDRSRGIWGRLGEVASMVPITVTVDDRVFDFRSVRHANLTPFLAAYLAQTSQASRGRLVGEQTIGLRIEMNYLDHEPAVYQEVLASAEAPAQAAAIVAGLLAYLENSIFEVPELGSIAVELRTEERLHGAELVDVIPLRRVVHPGEILPVRLRFRPFRGQEYSRELEIRVPAGIPEGRLDLVVADGASWSLYDFGMRPFRPGSFADEIKLLNSLIPSTSVVMVFERRQTGVALEGGSVAMPPSLVFQLSAGLGPGLTTTSYAVAEMIETEMDTPVSGAERIELRVRSERPMEHPEVP